MSYDLLMRNLLRFILKYGNLLLFILLEAVAVFLIFRQNAYQKSSILTSANRVSASILSWEKDVVSYFDLREKNEALAFENNALRNEIACLQELVEQRNDSLNTYAKRGFHYIPAKVVNITTTQARNYLTLNKGEEDGIAEGMGVISSDGVVGVVKSVSSHYALVIPIINPDLTVSCQLAKNGQLGSLEWQHRDARYASLNAIARHIDVAVGDTIQTSGRSFIFPSDIPVGIVEEDELPDNVAFHKIKVRLAVDFRTLRYVYILANPYQDEQLY